jgi:hypothetical protein
MRLFFEKLSAFQNKETLSSIIIIASHLTFAMFLSLVIAGLIYNMVNNNHQGSALSHQLETMNRQLVQLSSNGEDTAAFKTSLTDISSNIVSMKQSVDNNAKSSELTKISSQINVIKENIDELKKMITESGNAKEYLDTNILPFQVISVDVISQQPFVSIDYQHHVTPLGVGDTVAGWQITDADYASASVEFKNDKNQYIKVNLQG